jgi:uncharacterized repeat protein (TIGR03803 family)
MGAQYNATMKVWGWFAASAFWLAPLVRHSRPRKWHVLVLLGFVFIAFETTLAQSYEVIYNFTGGADGAHPLTGMTVAGEQAFYGTTNDRGLDWGTVFKFSRPAADWNLNTLFSFTPWNKTPLYGNGGTRTTAGITLGPNGGLYATTESGGNMSGCGAVYELVPSQNAFFPQWSQRVVYQFGGNLGGHHDGCGPNATVIFDHAGSIYGTTFQGGAYTYGGTVYKITPTPSGWEEAVLWNFGDGSDGSQPFNSLIIDRSGNLYGTTTRGGQYNWGTVFELTPSPSGWTETILHDFQNEADGAVPYTGLISDQSGNLYGATVTGGENHGGTVFQLTRSGNSWIFQVLYALTGGGPNQNLLIGSDGSLFGVTTGGGTYGHGSVFRLSPTVNGWAYGDLHDFQGPPNDGAYPWGGLVFDAHGEIYGTTDNGGLYDCDSGGGCGIIFKLAP